MTAPDNASPAAAALRSQPASPMAAEPVTTQPMSPGAAQGPTELSSRALGPDLARGLMLLFIALANSHYFLRGAEVLGGYPRDGSTVDSIVVWLVSTFVDGRAFPMFGLLFGYGVAHIVRRNDALPPRAVRRLLWRRSAVLVAVGFAHAELLYVGDILSAYGVLLAVGAWTVRWKDRWLIATAAAFFVLGALPSGGSSTISSDGPDNAMLPPDLATMLLDRPPTALVVAVLGPIGFMCPFLIGMWAGRHRIIDQPEHHRRLLRIVAASGIGAAVLGAQPISLMLADVITTPDQSTLKYWGPLHDATGVCGGLGYAAALTLIAMRHHSRRPWIDAIAAVGQRSMTCYLAQSVVWTIVFTPFLLDLSDTLTVTTTAIVAACTWLATVALANWMRRTERRGPFETLVRRITYRHPASATP